MPTTLSSGTSGDDLFTLAPTVNLTITGYDQAGQDALAVPMGPGGFSLASYTGAATLNVVDAAAWWNSISGAQVVRWTGDPTAVDSVDKVDALLQSMPGNMAGGVLFIGDAPGDRIAVYYDSAPNQSGGNSVVATLEGLATPAALNASDFKPFTPIPGTARVDISVGSNAGGTVVNGALSLPEGNAEIRQVAYYVSRTGDLSQATTVAYTVASNTFVSGAGASPSDFAGGAFPTGSVTFAPGESLKEIFIPVGGDTAFEPDEGYTVTISSGTATVGQGSQAGLIANDDSEGPPPPGGGTGTSGNDLFTLSPTANLTITGYDAAGQDALGIPTGPGGFFLAGYTNQASLTVVDAAAWWNSIADAQVVRWTGDPTQVDSAAEVDALLQSMPGNGGGGRLFIGDAPGDRIAVYYDSNPAVAGGAVQVATLEGITTPTALNASDFKPGSGSPGGGTGSPGDDLFALSPTTTLTITGYDVAGRDALGIPTGAGGFSLAGYQGLPQLAIVDAAAWWSNISGAEVVRWTGDITAADTAAEVDALLQAMPGNAGGGRLFVGGAAGGKVGVYYDTDPATAGNAALVAVIDNLTDPRFLGTTDFRPSGSPPPPSLIVNGAFNEPGVGVWPEDSVPGWYVPTTGSVQDITIASNSGKDRFADIPLSESLGTAPSGAPLGWYGEIAQDVEAETGQAYTLRWTTWFAFSQLGPHVNGVEVLWDGQPITGTPIGSSSAGPDFWQTYEATVIGQPGTDTLTFHGDLFVRILGAGSAVDDVSLIAV